MKNLSRILGWCAATVVGLLLVVFIVLKLIPDSTYEGWITEGVSSATGRELTFDEFDLGIGARIRLNATGISFANAEWGSRPDLFSADQMNFQLRLIPILWGVADFSFLLENPDILMETDGDGNGNWELAGTTSEPGAESPDTPEQADEADDEDSAEGTPSSTARVLNKTDQMVT